MANGGILEQAQKLVEGDRQQSYDHPIKNFQRIADLWNGYLKTRTGELTPKDVALMMVLLKIGREVYRHTDDNLIDCAGYIFCADKIENYDEDNT